MTSSFRQIRDLFLLLCWGGFVLWLATTHQLSTYLHPSLQPYTLAGGVLLVILAVFALRELFTGKKKEDSCCHHQAHSCCAHEHEHHAHEKLHGHPTHEEQDEHESHEGHHHGEGGLIPLLFKTALLLLPLVVIFLGQADHYTMNTVANRGVVQNLDNLPSAKAKGAPVPVVAPTGENATTNAPASGAMPIQVIDLLYAVQMPSYREEFEGKQVEMTAQFVPLTTGNPKGDRFQAIRLFITCCAADAKPVGVTVQYDKPLKVSEMGWVKITGTPTFPMEGGKRTAVLVADKVEECPAPDEPFVY
jgi:uncharacterized repeat protein (TIGR03943 family)